MARNFRELEAKMTLERIDASNQRVDRVIAEMPLEELRAAREMTQTYLAAKLGTDQASISRMERRADLYVSSLTEFIRGLGGELEIRAIFPEGSIKINRFGHPAKKLSSPAKR